MPNDREIARLLGLAVAPPRGKLTVSPEALAVRAAARTDAAIAEILGDETRQAIERDLDSAGIAFTEPWVYSEMLTAEVDARRFMLTRIITRTSHGRVMPWPTLNIPFAWQNRHRGWRLEMFGLVVGSDHPDEPPRAPWMWWLPSGAMKVTVRRMRAIPPDPVRPVTIGEWRPGWPKVTCTYDRPSRSKADIRATEIGQELLANIEAGPDGRRKGSGDFPDTPTFRRKVDPIVIELLQRPGKRNGKATRDEAAEKLNLDSGYLRDITHDRVGMDWPDYVDLVRAHIRDGG